MENSPVPFDRLMREETGPRTTTQYLLLLLSAFVVYWEIAKEQHLSEVIAVYDCCCRTDYQVIGEASGSKVR